MSAASSPDDIQGDRLHQDHPSAAEASNQNFVVGISPFLDPASKDQVYRSLVRLIVEHLPLHSSLEVFDAYHLRSITRLAVPDRAVFKSPKTRANQFAASIQDIRRFLSNNNPRPEGLKEGLPGAIRLPQFCDFLNQSIHGGNPRTPLALLLIGSPLYQDTKEPQFSMLDGYYPSDGHLRASREESVFGFNPGTVPAQELRVYWAYYGDPWASEMHRENVERFWSLYLEQRGGCVASFSGDLATALSAFSAEAPGASAASRGWVLDKAPGRPEMIRASRIIPSVEWLTGDLDHSAAPPAPSQRIGPLKIGIRWKDNIDLDLYALPRPGAQTLFFQHLQSPEGSYYKDIRSSPGKEYEYVEFNADVDIREVRAFVNFYAGSCPVGPRGEVRLEFHGRVYRSEFALSASQGNQGRSGRSQAGCWTEIPILEILGVAPKQTALR